MKPVPEQDGDWTQSSTVLICGATSALLLVGALLFQFGLGYRPCHMCLRERWLHALVLACACCACTGIRHTQRGRMWHDLTCIALLFIAAGAGFHHAAVEAGWVAASCGMEGVSATAPEAMLASLPSLPAPSCDNVAWTFLGMSMALWNGLLSAGAASASIFISAGRGT